MSVISAILAGEQQSTQLERNIGTEKLQKEPKLRNNCKYINRGFMKSM